MTEPQGLKASQVPDIEKRWRKLAGRDLQLWSIGFLVMLVMVAGMISQFAPAWFQGQARIKLDFQYIPVLTLGLVALVLLLNFYLIGQRRSLDLMRYDLIREMAMNHALQQVATIDPETQLFTRVALSRILTSEISRANRFGTDLSFTMIRCDNFELIRKRKSPFTADQMIVETASLLRKTFRGSDTVIRHSKSEFLVVMPQTSQAQAVPALNRLAEALDQWNIAETADFELAVSYGISSYKTGEPPEASIERANQYQGSLQGMRIETLSSQKTNAELPVQAVIAKQVTQ